MDMSIAPTHFTRRAVVQSLAAIDPERLELLELNPRDWPVQLALAARLHVQLAACWAVISRGFVFFQRNPAATTAWSGAGKKKHRYRGRSAGAQRILPGGFCKGAIAHIIAASAREYGRQEGRAAHRMLGLKD